MLGVISMAKWGRLWYCTAPGCHRPTHLVQPRLSSVCVAGMPLAAAQCCGTGGGVCLSQLHSWTLAQPQAATQVVLYFVINSSAPTSSLCLKWKLFIGRTRGYSYPLLQPARCGPGRGAALQRGVRGAAPVGSGFCSALALPPGSASPPLTSQSARFAGGQEFGWGNRAGLNNFCSQYFEELPFTSDALPLPCKVPVPAASRARGRRPGKLYQPCWEQNLERFDPAPERTSPVHSPI